MLQHKLSAVYRAVDDLHLKLLFWLFPSLRERQSKTPYQAFATAPTLISIARGAGFGPLVFALGPEQQVWTAFLLTGAVYSDLLDGCLARIEGPTWWGAFCDPIADRIFFFWFMAAHWASFDLWPLVAVATTEVAIFTAPLVLALLGKISFRASDWSANIFGKSRFVLECAAMVLALAGQKHTASTLLLAALPLAAMATHHKVTDALRPVQKARAGAAD